MQKFQNFEIVSKDFANFDFDFQSPAKVELQQYKKVCLTRKKYIHLFKTCFSINHNICEMSIIHHCMGRRIPSLSKSSNFLSHQLSHLKTVIPIHLAMATKPPQLRIDPISYFLSFCSTECLSTLTHYKTHFLSNFHTLSPVNQ